ncbi:MAG: ATP-binding protein [Candidatus Eremiobacterota bacterium]
MQAIDGEHRSRDQLLALYEIGRALNSTLELSELLQRILAAIVPLFDAEAGSIMLIEGNALSIKAATGLSQEIIESTRVPLGQGIAGWVAQTGEVLLLNGKVEDPRFRGLVERSDEIASSLCTPLRHRDRITGVLMVRRSAHSLFTMDQMDFFASVADQAALAIENARLFRDAVERADQVERERRKSDTILASMADGVVVSDLQGLILHSNQRAAGLLTGGPVEGRLPDLLPSLAFDHIIGLVTRGQGPYEGELRLGTEQVLRVTATALGSQGVVFLFHDETERARIERMKSEFLSMVSHELKTPITTIQAFLELLIYREFPPERRRHFLEISLQEGRRLQKLIEDILELARLESGRFRLSRTSCNLLELIESILPGYVERFPRHRFLVNVDGPLPLVEVDTTLLAQALTNLISNAVKYSPEGGDITLRLRQEGARIACSVSDQGIGIPKDKIPYIFEKFYRVDNSLTRETGGTGLGLANARYIVESHGGSIWAESEVGRGSVFTLALPV